ncbi:MULTISPECIES: hypothetical protein [unclassified Amycolatopsis]|uniref:DUF7660 family protein n=1 Tax=unclassified Amycolatopsis TaxID=2618356 RepID=UPI0028767122|nr:MULTISPECIES: hypothetical protein [unclassified Amycolatopsis]MDS0134988.1 hypothetical protein [Amycolatopsis sp. 505]MDS0148816.1 hypothetical protein [Amycolatopsis sp. CM201R]
MSEENRLCRRCGYPVRLNRDDYETFERMHFVCFHYEFEHRSGVPDNDPDVACGLLHCPSAPAARHKDELVAVVTALAADCSEGVPAFWANDTLPRYLEALAAWLTDRGGDYPIEDTWSGWEVAAKAMRAATSYEP